MSSSPTEMKIKVGAFLVMFAVSIGFFIAGFVQNRSSMKPYASCTVEAAGTVVSVDTYTDGEGKTEYSPMVDFEANGETYTLSVARTLTVYKEGEAMTVRYDPDDPFTAYAKEEPPKQGSAKYLIGGTCLIIGILSLFVKPRRRHLTIPYTS